MGVKSDISVASGVRFCLVAVKEADLISHDHNTFSHILKIGHARRVQARRRTNDALRLRGTGASTLVQQLISRTFLPRQILLPPPQSRGSTSRPSDTCTLSTSTTLETSMTSDLLCRSSVNLS